MPELALVGVYGKEPAFLRGRAPMDKASLVDVHKHQAFCLDDPQSFVPGTSERRGRPHMRRQTYGARRP